MAPFYREKGEPERVNVTADKLIRQVRDYAMFLVDRSGRAASWNEGVLRVLGWPEEEWLGQPAHVAFTEEDAEAGVPEQELRTAETLGRADDDRWMRRKSGERFFANGSVVPIRDEEGRVVAYLKVLRDGTAGRKTFDECERALAAEQRGRQDIERQAAVLRATLEAIPDALYIVTQEGVVESNRQGLQMLGVASPEDLRLPVAELGRRYRVRHQRESDLLASEDLPMARALNGETVELKTWMTNANGEDLQVRANAAPVRVRGHIVAAVSVHSDLKERAQFENQQLRLASVETRLRERDQEFQALVAGVRDYAIFTVGVDGLISSWHVGAQLMKGYTAEEAIGMPFADLFTPEDQAAGRPEMEMQTAAERGVYKGDGKRLRKSGESFEASVVLTALRGPQDELLGYLKLTEDITHRKRAETEREEMLRNAQSARADAERASHSKDEFLATISHELRTPLSAILGWAHLLERGVFDADNVKAGLAAIKRNARVQVQLIEDLLDMNRIESGHLRLEMQPVDLAEVVAGAVEAVLPSAKAKTITLRTLLDPNAGVIHADPARLQQIVWNLLSNAVKFTPEEGRVTVTVSREGDTVEITVTDTGQGMEKEFLERAFDRFQQQDATSTRRYGGLGLGLAIVRHLAALHDGTVRAESGGPGQGSTFVVALPVQGRSAVPAPLPAEPGARERQLKPDDDRLAGFTVLVIDDAEDSLTVARHALGTGGALVLTAGSAKAGLQSFKEHGPHAILCDIGMPVHDGHDFIRWVREIERPQGRHTPAAAFTAYTRPEDRQQALDAGYDLHLGKPLGPVDLVEAVVDLLQHAQGVIGNEKG